MVQFIAVDKCISKWLYWKPLLFLAPVLQPRPTEGNLNLIEELVVPVPMEETDGELEID